MHIFHALCSSVHPKQWTSFWIATDRTLCGSMRPLRNYLTCKNCTASRTVLCTVHQRACKRSTCAVQANLRASCIYVTTWSLMGYNVVRKQLAAENFLGFCMYYVTSEWAGVPCMLNPCVCSMYSFQQCHPSLFFCNCQNGVKIFDGTPLPVFCEEDVFRILDIPYREPKERDWDWENLSIKAE